MDVAQLISKLEELPVSTPVIIASDAEGNSVAKLAAIEVSKISDGELVYFEGDDDPEDFPDAQPCVVLWPA